MIIKNDDVINASLARVLSVKTIGRYLYVILLLICSSCMEKKNVMKPEDLIFTSESYFKNPKEILNQEDIKNDVDLLLYALNKGYGAKNFLPQGQLETAFSKLEKIKDEKKIAGKEFCEAIGDILWAIQDGHLTVKRHGLLCGKQAEWTNRKGRVGQNFALKKNKESKFPWYIEKRLIGAKVVGLISILYYPNFEDKAWSGFMEKAKTLLDTDFIVIDLRGNDGGDDTMGFQLAGLLQDRKVMPGWDKTIVNQSAETYALSLNNFIIRKLNFEKKQQEIPEYVNTFLSRQRESLELAKSGKLDALKEYTWNQNEYPVGKKAYQGRVIILADRECISSGESSLEVLAKHPKAKVYGENTGGKYHFGNVSTLVLPISKISIGIASKYNAYNDGRNIDKFGISPDFKISDGDDALEFVLKEIGEVKKVP